MVASIGCSFSGVGFAIQKPLSQIQRSTFSRFQDTLIPRSFGGLGFNTPETNGAVREAYESDNPALVQSAIYGMGQSSNADWLPTVVDEMTNLLAAVRYEAATACGLLGEESVVPHLVQRLRDDDSEVRLASVKALGLIGGTLAKSALQQHLSDGDEATGEAAQEALIGLEFNDDPLSYSFGA